MPEGLRIDLDKVKSGGTEITIVAGEGELDLATAGLLGAKLEEAREAPVLLLDLSRVAFIDSTGVRLLMETSKDRSDRGAPFTVVADPQSQVVRILELTEAVRLLDLADSRETALRRLESGQTATAG